MNMLNIFFIFLFTALASGGAVVVSQYIGSRDRKNSSLPQGSCTCSPFCFPGVMGATLLWDRPLLGLLFGQVEPDVMQAGLVYLRISAYSYPALALYNCRRLAVPQHEQDQGDHACLPSDERHQRGGKRYRHFCPSRGGGWRGLAFYDLPGICGRGHDGALLLGEKSRCPHLGRLFTWNSSMVRRLDWASLCPTPSRTACSSWRKWR